MEAANFQMHSDERPGEARLSVSGELDLSAAPRLARAADKLLEDEPQRLLLDLSGLRFIDSSGLRTIIVLHQRASQEGWTAGGRASSEAPADDLSDQRHGRAPAFR